MKTKIPLVLFTLLPILGVRAQGTAFTYQGRLNDGANPANGTYDLRFAVYDSSTNPGVLIAGPLTNSSTSLSNGLFTVTLDFGAVFDGSPRWLEIAVRTNGSTGFNALSPRQQLTPAPYAIFANSASNFLGTVSPAQLSGTYSGPVNFNNGADTFDGTFIGQFLGSTFTGGTFTGNFIGTGSGIMDVWHTTGNLGTTAANFLGTTDNQPLVIKVNGQRAQRFEPTADSPNLIGGWSGNSLQSGLTGVTIGGGGSPILFNGKTQPNVATNGGSYSTIGGGYNNTAANYGVSILGGGVNMAGGFFSAIVGGQSQTNLGDFSFIGGGFQNAIQTNDYESVIVGGYENTNSAPGAVIGGGVLNEVSGGGAFIGGGGYDGGTIAGNAADGGGDAIGAGVGNAIHLNSYDSFIGGGYFNTIQSNSAVSVIAGGQQNTIDTNDALSAIGGGILNNIQGNSDQSVIAGGNANVIQPFARESFIGGGFLNYIQTNAAFSFIGGGTGNNIGTNSTWATIGGGENNQIQGGGSYGTIAGGFQNTNAGPYATIAGGLYNGVGGYESVIGGGVINNISTNSSIDVIGGGLANTISNNSATVVIGGGEHNIIGAFVGDGVIVGGSSNSLFFNESAPAIVGGILNSIRSGGDYSFIGGGALNTNSGYICVISGGQNNNIGVLADHSVIGGGGNNQITGSQNLPVYATISGGFANTIQTNTPYATIPGGLSNSAAGAYSFAAGRRAKALHDGSFVWADSTDADFTSTTTNEFSIRAMGGLRLVTSTGIATLNGSPILSGTVPGGDLAGTYSNAVNFNNSGNSFTGNGAGLTSLNASNVASGTLADARLSTNVALLNAIQTFGGTNVFSTASQAFHPGFRVTDGANGNINLQPLGGGNSGFQSLNFNGFYDGSEERFNLNKARWRIVVDQRTTSDLMTFDVSTGPASVTNLIAIQTNGFIGIGTSTPTNRLHVVGGITCTALTQTSDRNAKENFAPVSPQEVLDKVASLPISTWNFKDLHDGRHMGPMAQDFYAAFHLGGGDTTITAVDPDGVALAAIQGLNQKLHEKDAEIEALKTRLERLEELVDRNVTHHQ
jgi:hypothetical protein